MPTNVGLVRVCLAVVPERCCLAVGPKGWKSKREISAFDSWMKQSFMRPLTCFFLFFHLSIHPSFYFASGSAVTQLFPDQRQFLGGRFTNETFFFFKDKSDFNQLHLHHCPLEGAKDMEDPLNFW